MQNQNQQQQGMQNSNQMQPQMNFGGHELFDVHEAMGSVVGTLEHYLLYEEHIQDQQLMSMLQRHRTFLTQLYNTAVNTLKTGQDPAVDTQTYKMEQSNDVIFGMQPSAPKKPSQSVSELNDECISSFMLGQMKALASGFTMTALEATNPVLRRVFQDSIPNLIEMGYEVFLYQNKNQYYQVPQLMQQDMQNYTNSFAPIQGTMPH
ncbi:spore coat protein [Virgibacillus sp. W0181]|uniref:spore coat protein n=1 Tax=Virgibacillus sp. W0181 TaxID=3391581 RepID=UPI003F484902